MAEAVTIRERHSSVLAPWDDLETRLLRRLSDAVLREKVIDYAVEGIREELQKRFEELNAGLGQMRQMKRQIEGELARLVQAIAENPRYFLARKRLWRAFREDYFAVPDILARKKEIAEFFAKRWGRRVGPVQLVYARTPEGRRMLLRARVHSLAGAFQKRSERVSCWK